MIYKNNAQIGNRLHICIGYTCNNNCIFCMEDEREARRNYVISQSNEDILKMILENRNVDEILFTSGEPTLNKNFLTYIKWAKEAGIKTIGLISNGRRLAYKDFAYSILSSGVNNIVISIHGHNSKLHDSLTRTRGSFEQTYKSIINLSELKERFKFRLATSTVVNKKNLLHIKEICILLIPHLIDQFIFNVMMPDGRGNTYFKKLMPKYTDVAREFSRISSELSTNSLNKVFLVDIPLCTTTKLPDSVRGFVERFFHYEPEGSIGHSKYETYSSNVAQGFSPDKNLFEKQALIGDTIFSKITRSFKDMLVKEKREECSKCRYDKICAGVYKTYIANYEWDGFEPVKNV